MPSTWVILAAAVLAGLSPAAVDAVRCLECNDLPDGAARSPCPGAALINFGAKFDVSSDECVRRPAESTALALRGFDYRTN